MLKNRLGLSIFLVLLGLGARLILAPFSGHPWDIYVWIQVVDDIYIRHASPFSAITLPVQGGGWYDYPSPWLWFLSMSVLPYILMHKLTILPSYASGLVYDNILNYLPDPKLLSDLGLIFFTKLPMIIFDCLTLVILRKLLKDKSLGLKLFFLSPFVIFLGSGWGMFDIIPAFGALLAYFFYTKNTKQSRIFSALALGFAVSVKIYPLILLPAFLSTERGSKWWKPTLSQLKFAALTAFLPIVVYVFDQLRFGSTIGNALVAQATRVPNGDNWMTLWPWLREFLPATFNVPGIWFGTISPDYWYLSYFVSYSLIGLIVFLIYISKHDLLTKIVFSILTWYAISIFMHPQFFIFIVPFAVLLVDEGRLKSSTYWGITVLFLIPTVLDALLFLYFAPLYDFLGMRFVSFGAMAKSLEPWMISQLGNKIRLTLLLWDGVFISFFGLLNIRSLWTDFHYVVQHIITNYKIKDGDKFSHHPVNS